MGIVYPILHGMFLLGHTVYAKDLVGKKIVVPVEILHDLQWAKTCKYVWPFRSLLVGSKVSAIL